MIFVANNARVELRPAGLSISNGLFPSASQRDEGILFFISHAVFYHYMGKWMGRQEKIAIGNLLKNKETNFAFKIMSHTI